MQERKIKIEPKTPPNTPVNRPPRLRHYTPLVWEPTAYIVEEQKAEEIKEIKSKRCVIL